MVRAIDPYADPKAGSGEANEVGGGNSATVTITITVKDVNEAPGITGGPYHVEASGEFSLDRCNPG